MWRADVRLPDLVPRFGEVSTLEEAKPLAGAGGLRGLGEEVEEAGAVGLRVDRPDAVLDAHGALEIRSDNGADRCETQVETLPGERGLDVGGRGSEGKIDVEIDRVGGLVPGNQRCERQTRPVGTGLRQRGLRGSIGIAESKGKQKYLYTTFAYFYANLCHKISSKCKIDW